MNKQTKNTLKKEKIIKYNYSQNYISIHNTHYACEGRGSLSLFSPPMEIKRSKER